LLSKKVEEYSDERKQGGKKKMVRVLVFKKFKRREGRVFISEKRADTFISGVRRAGGAKLVKIRLVKKNLPRARRLGFTIRR